MEPFNTLSGQIMVGVLGVINLVAFCVMARDKHKAVRGRSAERTPEGIMFFIAVMFGGVGVYLGMLAFRHKTKTWYFQLGIPFLILQNLAMVYVVWEIIAVG